MTLASTHILMKALIRDLFVCILLALIFAFLGVYDSDNLAWPSRIIFWTVIMCLGGILMFALEPFVFGKLLKNHHPMAQIFAISALVSVPITVFLVGMNTRFGFDWSLTNWGLQFCSVIIISLLIVSGCYVISQFMGSKTKAD